MDTTDASGPTFPLPPAEASAYGAWNPEAPPDPGAAPHPKRTMIAGAVAAVVVGLAGFLGIRAITSHSTPAATSAPAGAAGAGAPGFGRRGFGGPGAGGTIAAINGTTLSLTTTSGGTLTVRTTASTAVTTSSAVAVSDIKVGDNVLVVGTASGSTIAARGINDSGAAAAGTAGPAGASGFTSGSVTAINGGTLTVTESNGTQVTVTTSSSTPVTILQTLSMASLSPGQTVRVTGTTNSDGSLTATSIREGAGAGPGFAPRGPAA